MVQEENDNKQEMNEANSVRVNANTDDFIICVETLMLNIFHGFIQTEKAS